MRKPYTLRRETWRDKVRGRFSGSQKDFPSPEELADKREKIRGGTRMLAKKLAIVSEKAEEIAESIDEALANIGRSEDLKCRAEGLVAEAEDYLHSLHNGIDSFEESFNGIGMAIELSEVPPSRNLKTDELEGSLLNLWTARAEKLEAYIGEDGQCHVIDGDQDFKYDPSTDWSQGGPILERERIELERHRNNTWRASIDFDNDRYIGETGPSQLAAGMRCFIKSKFGDEVPKDER